MGFDDDRRRSAPVPTGRVARLLHMGGIAGGIAGGVMAGGLREVARGRRPALPDLMLTPANAARLTDGLSRMRGAALKIGQMMSMDAGTVLPPELTTILSALRDDATHMPPKQLQGVLNAEWGTGWRKRFDRFDVRPFAAASIGQVHRARTYDGHDLAIKVQYPGVQGSIDSDVDNIATLFRLPGLIPRGMDLSPLLAEAKAQLHAEADYAAEAAHLAAFGAHLADDRRFVLPQVAADFSTARVLAMTYLPSAPIESLAAAPQDRRDAAAAALIELVLRELFDLGAMQTDPNLANYRVDPDSGRIVLLDFGATRDIPLATRDDFRDLLNAALDGGQQAVHAAMLRIGYVGPDTPAHQHELIAAMFDTAMTPLRSDAPFDFARSDLLERLRDMGLAIGSERELMHVPPAQTLFLHRKIGGMYLLAARLGARVSLGPLVRRWR